GSPFSSGGPGDRQPRRVEASVSKQSLAPNRLKRFISVILAWGRGNGVFKGQNLVSLFSKSGPEPGGDADHPGRRTERRAPGAGAPQPTGRPRRGLRRGGGERWHGWADSERPLPALPGLLSARPTATESGQGPGAHRPGRDYSGG